MKMIEVRLPGRNEQILFDPDDFIIAVYNGEWIELWLTNKVYSSGFLIRQDADRWLSKLQKECNYYHGITLKFELFFLFNYKNIKYYSCEYDEFKLRVNLWINDNSHYGITLTDIDMFQWWSLERFLKEMGDIRMKPF